MEPAKAKAILYVDNERLGLPVKKRISTFTVLLNTLPVTWKQEAVTLATKGMLARAPVNFKPGGRNEIEYPQLMIGTYVVGKWDDVETAQRSGDLARIIAEQAAKDDSAPDNSAHDAEALRQRLQAERMANEKASIERQKRELEQETARLEAQRQRDKEAAAQKAEEERQRIIEEHKFKSAALERKKAEQESLRVANEKSLKDRQDEINKIDEAKRREHEKKMKVIEEEEEERRLREEIQKLPVDKQGDFKFIVECFPGFRQTQVYTIFKEQNCLTESTMDFLVALPADTVPEPKQPEGPSAEQLELQALQKRESAVRSILPQLQQNLVEEENVLAQNIEMLRRQIALKQQQLQRGRAMADTVMMLSALIEPSSLSISGGSC